MRSLAGLRRIVVAATFAVLLGACGAGASNPSSETTTGGPPTAEVDFDGPDPAILVARGTYWLFTTSAGGLRVPVRSATGSGAWGEPVDALPERPLWAGRDDVWAPGPIEAEGRYVLWFSIPTDADDGLSQCIGVAVADEPGGPYEPMGDVPAICNPNGPTIDPFPWRDQHGNLYLAWTEYNLKSGAPTEIRASALDDGGTQLVGEPVVLLTDPSGWEKIILENPALFDGLDGRVRLLYSANLYYTADYATGTATCAGPLGPCTRDTPGQPWFGSREGLNGPGGMAVFTASDGQIWTVFHAWGDVVGYKDGGRRAPHVEQLTRLPALP